MSLIRSGMVVGFLTLMSRILGFVRDIFITSILGASLFADCFNIAFRLPNFFRRIFAEGAFSSAFVPIFSSKLASEGQGPAQNFANRVFTIMLLVLFSFIILLELILPLLMYVLAPGLIASGHHEAVQLATDLSRITIPYLLFISLASLIGGVLNSIGRFTSFAAVPIVLNLGLLTAIIYAPGHMRGAAYALAWGVLVSGILQLLIMIIASFRAKVPFRLVTDITAEADSKKLFKNMIPAVLGGGVMQINILIDQAVASFLPAGAISVLIYADRINQLPLALIGTAIGTILLPTLSKQLKTGDNMLSLYTQNRALEIALLLSIPAAIALIACAQPFTYMLYERGAFSAADTSRTAHALMAFATSLPAYVVVKVFAPVFFARQDTTTPVKISLVCLLANCLVAVVLMKPLGHVGIAVATSVSAWINAMSLFYILSARRFVVLDARVKAKTIRIVIASLLMGASLYLYNELIVVDNILSICGLIITGKVSFLISGYITKAFEWREIKQIVRAK